MIPTHGVPEAEPGLAIRDIAQVDIGDARQERSQRVEKFPIATRRVGSVVRDLEIPFFREPEQPVRMIERPGRCFRVGTSAVLDRNREIAALRDVHSRVDRVEPNPRGRIMERLNLWCVDHQRFASRKSRSEARGVNDVSGENVGRCMP